ncbi:rhodanese-like domain-containing protein [Phormidium sp. CLA17]|uniref:rhodanese-like domain-containing protein n=1 Tax=Leptolyngbya sp. Cla-17 TaxID=2803751 RepID=UPI0014913BAD|nr:rhodanese-like domain-containing protein [Leptolyngbya sp. Cla-17]MBM0740952.1 rhodanese-like domain-containing protein [Leptolyngbya sp. Cla-17]
MNNETGDAIKQPFDEAHEREENTLEKAKVAFSDKLPISTPAAAVSSSEVSVHELKSRLNWGEPGLTILDVRDRDVFDDCRILGAMNTPVSILPGAVQSTLQFKRDIYIYGSNDGESTTAANILREAGFHQVAVLKGGLEAWLKIDGSVDGVNTNTDPGPDAYNVFSRLKEFANERAKEKSVS